MPYQEHLNPWVLGSLASQYATITVSLLLILSVWEAKLIGQLIRRDFENLQ